MADLLENWHLPLTDFMQRVQTYYGQATRQRLDADSVVTRQSLRVAEWHLYGSSRLGIYKTQDTLRTVDLSLVYKLSDVNIAPTQTLSKKEYYSFDSTYTHKRGDKLYEGSNHLGNVLVTFSDKRLAECLEGSVHYRADVRSATDYAAFGALLDDRQWYSGLDSGVYRAGFNGMEKDDEVKGVGHSIVFEYRIHDTRLGRFLSVDPLKDSYPWNSTYAFAENVVIRCIDLEGAEVFDPQTGQSGPWNPNYLHGSSKEAESLLGGLYMPEYVMEGVQAHRAFKDYFRRMDPDEIFWKAERAISPTNPNRPDLVYNNGATGGVWELKPMPPRPGSVLARIEAIEYCRQLNSAGKFGHEFYKPGSEGNAPIPFKGGWEIITDEVSKNKFYFIVDPLNQGAIYYQKMTGPNAPLPVVSDKPITIPNVEPVLNPKPVLINPSVRLIEPIQDSPYHYDYIPTYNGVVSPEAITVAVGIAVVVSVGTRFIFPARNFIPIP